MKTFLKTTVAASALALTAGAAMAEGKLVIYHWFEYIPQELVDKFTAETGIAVTYQPDDKPIKGRKYPLKYYWVEVFAAP